MNKTFFTGGFIATLLFTFLLISIRVTHRRCGRIQLFRERLSGKVHATILKGIVAGFEFSFFNEI